MAAEFFVTILASKNSRALKFFNIEIITGPYGDFTAMSTIPYSIPQQNSSYVEPKCLSKLELHEVPKFCLKQRKAFQKTALQIRLIYVWNVPKLNLEKQN